MSRWRRIEGAVRRVRASGSGVRREDGVGVVYSYRLLLFSHSGRREGGASIWLDSKLEGYFPLLSGVQTARSCSPCSSVYYLDPVVPWSAATSRDTRFEGFATRNRNLRLAGFALLTFFHILESLKARQPVRALSSRLQTWLTSHRSTNTSRSRCLR